MDPRIARTRTSLQSALLELAHENGLNGVTVAEITERAGVNRSTFYQHYDDKDTLLADALDAAMAQIGSTVGASVDPDGVPAEIHAYLHHVRENIALYREVLGDHGSAIVSARLRQRLDAIISRSIAASPADPYPDVPLDIAVAGVAGAAIGVIRAWVARDPLPPVDDAARWMWSVVTGPVALLQEIESAARLHRG